MHLSYASETYCSANTTETNYYYQMPQNWILFNRLTAFITSSRVHNSIKLLYRAFISLNVAIITLHSRVSYETALLWKGYLDVQLIIQNFPWIVFLYFLSSKGRSQNLLDIIILFYCIELNVLESLCYELESNGLKLSPDAWKSFDVLEIKTEDFTDVLIAIWRKQNTQQLKNSFRINEDHPGMFISCHAACFHL